MNDERICEQGYAVTVGGRVDGFYLTLEESVDWYNAIKPQCPSIYSATRMSNRHGYPNIGIRLNSFMNGWLRLHNKI